MPEEAVGACRGNSAIPFRSGGGMTDLGGGKASAISDVGQVAGTAAGERAFITGPNGVGMTYLSSSDEFPPE
ncbi:hypothetical protein [Nitrosospira multiformis]|nr:hypothetical protein [Nitrosospira multiformis]